MIIFGTRGVKFTLKEGHFTCPQCANKQAFRHRKVRRFFTLYFIPVIPLDNLGEYVECKSCKGTFVPRVLDYNPEASEEAFLSEYEKAVKHCMVLIMLADGAIDPEEIKMVQKIINKYSHHDVALDELETYTNEVARKPDNISTYLKKVAPSLNAHGKEDLIRCALAVASADGHIDDSEVKLIKEMATIMDISNAHLKGILQEMLTPDTV